jgi:hypothetical protein
VPSVVGRSNATCMSMFIAFGRVTFEAGGLERRERLGDRLEIRYNEFNASIMPSFRPSYNC